VEQTSTGSWFTVNRRRDNLLDAKFRGFARRGVRQTRAVDAVGKRSQAVVSRSDSDKCVTRLVGEVTLLLSS